MKEESDESSMESVEFSDSDKDEDENVDVEDKTKGEGLEGGSPSPKKKIMNTQQLLDLMTVMVKEVRRNKKWLVRRLYKQIKLLKKKTRELRDSDVQKRKNKIRIIALQQEVFYSRILDISQTAKFLYLNTQEDLHKILSYSFNDTKPAVRFQAKLGIHFDSIKKKVERFHKAYPNYSEFLPVLFYENRQKRWSSLIKSGLFLNKSLARNEQTRHRSRLTAEGKKINHSYSIVDMFNSWSVTGEEEGSTLKFEPGDKGKKQKSVNAFKISNADSPTNESNTKESNLSTNESKSVSKEKQSSEKVNKNEPGPSREKKQKSENVNKKSNADLAANESNKKESNLSTKESESVSKEKKSSENTSKKRKFSDSEESIPTLVPINSKPLKVAKKDVEDTSPPPLKSDPFFLTADNREYMSSSKSKVPEYNPTKKEDNVPKKKFEKKPFTSRHNNFDPEKFNLKFEKKPAFNNKSNLDSKKNPKFSKRNTFGDKSNSKHQFNKNNKNFGNAKKINNEKPILHPSWQAKKKLSGITEFKGTKIQFD